MKKNFHALGKRALALLVSLTMCVSLLQITAFAAEGDSTSDNTSTTSPAADSAPAAGEGKTDTGVSVTVDKSETHTNEDGSTTETWTATGTDEKGVDVKIEGSTNTKDTPAETDKDGNVTEPGKTETTDSIKVTLTDKGEEHVLVPDSGSKDSAPTEKEDMDVANEKKQTDTVNLGKVEVSADVGNGNQNNTIEDHKSGTVDYNTIKDQVESLKPSTSDWGEQKTDDNGKTYWEKPGSVANEVVRNTIEEVLDKDGNVIGYKTITETIRTTEGDYQETGNFTNLGLTKDYSLVMNGNATIEDGAASVPTEVTLPAVPEVGSASGENEIVKEVNETEDGFTVTYEKVIGEPVSTPRVNEAGNPELDEDGNQIVDLVYPTVTRTETFTYDKSSNTYQLKVDETRKDTIIVDTVVDVNTVEIGNPTLSLDLVLGSIEDKSSGYEMSEGVPVPDIFEETLGSNTAIKDYLDKTVIGVNFLNNTKVTVTQTESGSNAYDASATIKLNLTKSLLTEKFKLTVTTGNGEVTYHVPDANGNEQGKNYLEFDEYGNVKDITLNGISTGSITLELTGRQKIDLVEIPNSSCQITSLHLEKDIDLKATINVTITEIKGGVMYEQFKKTDTMTDTKNFTRTDTVTETKTTLTTTTTDGVAGTKNDTTTQAPPTPEVPDTPDNSGDNTNPGGNGGGTGGGGGGGTTPTPPVDIPDDPNDVPLEPGPGVDTPDTPDVPENPGDVDIEEPDVPLAPGPDIPSDDVDIADNDVPMANKPSKPAGKNPVPQSSATGLTEIEEEAVPLAEVPKTGDNSAMWIAAAVLAACGLVALGQKKREEA